MTIKFDRFAFDSNLRSASHYRCWNSAFWPPAADYHVFCLDLTSRVPSQEPALLGELEVLGTLIDAESCAYKSKGASQESRMKGPGLIAGSLRRIADLLPKVDDQRALRLRADALENGYIDGLLSELVGIDEEITFVAGNISTWYGKQKDGLPTAFGCVRDADSRSAVKETMAFLGDIAAYIRTLHSHLRLAEIPAFSPTQLFFMAGEGNRHPKHIAYFLPEDEGVKLSKFNKTYYFVNTHRALIDAISLPLARRLLYIGKQIALDASGLEPIPTLGVLAHEFGHAVHREGTDFAALNSSDRWASLVLQETAADVFGFLALAEVLAPALGLSPADVVMYHLAECLRYVDRGLGHFADSDGMYLQLNYLATFGVLVIDPEGERLLAAAPEVVIAAFRSLARVLADTLLASEVRRSVQLYRTFGPSTCTRLAPLIVKLGEESQKTIEYVQEPRAAGVQEANEAVVGLSPSTSHSRRVSL